VLDDPPATGQPEPPLGVFFLDAISRLCVGVGQQSAVVLDHDLKGTREALGTFLSLLDQATSCWWGCRGGNHIAERFLAKCCQNAEAAYFLALSGFYDQSLSLSRSNMESANLCVLFAEDEAAFDEWRQADAMTRHKKFGPAAVRRLLEQKQLPVPIKHDQYALMCEKATHPSPKLAPGMYNVAGIPKGAGYFQPVGLGMALHQLVYPMVFVGRRSVQLLGLLDDPKGQHLFNAAEALNPFSERLEEYWRTLYAERLQGGNYPTGQPAIE
jgi:hypothetical protein